MPSLSRPMRTGIAAVLLILAIAGPSLTAQPLQATIISVTFEENHYFTARDLQGMIRSRAGMVFDAATLQSDLSSIVSSYTAQGFYAASAAIQRLEWNGDSSQVSISIAIDEGVRARVGKIVVEGNTLFTTDEVFLGMETQAGTVLDKQTLERDLDGLVKRYEREGYPFAAVTIDRIIPGSDSAGLTIGLAINEGQRVRIEEVRVQGNTETSEHVIVREAGIPTGKLYNSTTVEASVRRLKRMNLFTSVAEPELYTSDSGKGGVLFTVTEGSTNTFDGVLGYVPGNSTQGTDGYATGLVNVSMANLFGTARKLAVRWQKDDRFSQELAARYGEPWVFDLPVDLSLAFNQRQQDTTYVRRATEVGATVRLIDQLSAGGNISFESIIPSVTGAAFLASSRTTMTGVELQYDSRDDILGSTAGVFYHTSYKIGTKSSDAILTAPSSKTSVQRITIDGELYAQPFQKNVIATSIHARQLTAGSIELGDLYRFGGAATLRGYRENQFLGSRVAWANVEYRLLLGRRSYVFGFVDNGYYYVPTDSAAGIFESSAYKMGYGLGIRLETSLGNIGLSFALGQGDGFSQAKVHINLLNSF